MTMSESIDWERLARYVSGEASAAESAEVTRWMADDASHRELVASLERRWQSSGSPIEVDVDVAWSRLAARLPATGPEKVRVIPISRPPVPLARRLLPLAAAVVLAAGLGVAWYAVGGRGRASSGRAVAAGTIEERTGTGERRSLDLPDGSRVVLGVRSSVRATVATSARDVYLEGEALFTVRHDAARPFRVHAAGVVTEDLGTAFAVRAYPGDSAVRVAVTEGEVNLRREGETAGAGAVLRPRDVALLGREGSPEIRRDQPVDRVLAWSRGELIFDDTPLSAVIAEVERWYDVDVQLSDPSLASKHLTAEFRGEALDDVLNVIAVSLELRVERSGRNVVLRPGGRALIAPAAPHRVEAAG